MKQLTNLARSRSPEPSSSWHASKRRNCHDVIASFSDCRPSYPMTLCISMILYASPHNQMSGSSKKSEQGGGKTITCGKAKKISVKPQNVVGIFKRTQCLLFRQTGHRSLSISHFSIYEPLMHRVVHRSWGTACQGHLHSIDSGDRTSETGRVRGSRLWELRPPDFELRIAPLSHISLVERHGP